MLSALSSACDFKSHDCKQCGPRSDCSSGSSLIRVHTVCLYAKIGLSLHKNIQQTTFSDAGFLGILRVNLAGNVICKSSMHFTVISDFSLHPGDLYPYTRKPLFLIVDSDNSSAFQHFPNLFGQPVVCLLSPEQVPSNIPGTMFLKVRAQLFKTNDVVSKRKTFIIEYGIYPNIFADKM